MSLSFSPNSFLTYMCVFCLFLTLTSHISFHRQHPHPLRRPFFFFCPFANERMKNSRQGVFGRHRKRQSTAGVNGGKKRGTACGKEVSINSISNKNSRMTTVLLQGVTKRRRRRNVCLDAELWSCSPKKDV